MSGRAFFVVATLWPALVGAAAGQFTPLSRDLNDAGFRLIEVRSGVSVYQHRRSALINVAAEAWMAASPEALQRAFVDYQRQRQVIRRLAEVQILSRSSPAQLLVYQRLALPMVSDRDYVLDVRWGRQQDTFWVRYLVPPGSAVAPRAGVVRVPLHTASWQIRSDRRGASFVRYQMMLDLAGWIPRFLARRGAADELPELFENLCRLALSKELPQGTRCIRRHR
ncbi:MAG: hypothetical protein H6707_18025 [Deltaproteobacteria bacterium]|nr:hypothetical protein [Deltaproteobacteria bacterium]